MSARGLRLSRADRIECARVALRDCVADYARATGAGRDECRAALSDFAIGIQRGLERNGAGVPLTAWFTPEAHEAALSAAQPERAP